MSKAQVIQVTSIEVRKSSSTEDLIDGNPRQYKYVSVLSPEFQETTNPFTGEKMTAIGAVKSSATVVWEHFHAAIGGKLNPDYPMWNQGGFRLGALVTKKVTPYPIPQDDGSQRMADTATVLVLGDSTKSNWEETIELAFKAANFSFTPKVKEVETVEMSDFGG